MTISLEETFFSTLNNPQLNISNPQLNINNKQLNIKYSNLTSTIRNLKNLKNSEIQLIYA